MPVEEINGTPLAYEVLGAGEPLVLVHGSWVDRQTWVFAAPALANDFQVVMYDRRGHGESSGPPEAGTVHDDVADLAALIERLDLAPVNLVCNSFGGCVGLRLTVDRPDLVRRTVAHEPPLIELLADDPDAKAIAEDFTASMEAVMQLLVAGEHAAAAERFVEDVALGPGAWAQIPPPMQEVFVRNAPTFLGEMRDPDGFTIDVDRLARVSTPMLLSQGDQSPAMFAPIIDQVAANVPDATRHTYVGAGHVPHLTHLDEYVAEVTRFLRS